MPEFIVSWSAYGPSGRIEAVDQLTATKMVVTHLVMVGLQVAVYEGIALHCEEPSHQYDGDMIVIKSRVPRYGDMASFAVCVYPVGGHSWYDTQRDEDLARKAKEAEHAT